ncbi:cell wall anchor protein [Staphylococcus pasteuri]|uniref:cell wall anchor protein n=1 Tax=Staphylococcus pasteuri TaxID=45972 RepID=UPI0024C1792C
MKDKQTNKVSICLKLSCSALLISGSMIGYGFTNNMKVQAKDSSSYSTLESKEESLQDQIKKAKHDIKQLSHLNEEKQQDYLEQLDDVTDNTNLDKIIKKAKQEDNKFKSLKKQNEKNTDNEKANQQVDRNSNSDDNKDVTEDLDKMLKDLDISSSKVDNSQLNEDDSYSDNDKDVTAEQNKQRSKVNSDDKKSNVIEDLDKIKQDTTLDEEKGNNNNQHEKVEPSNNSKKAQSNHKEQTKRNLQKQNNIEDKENQTSSQVQQLIKDTNSQSTNNKAKDKVNDVTKKLEGSDKIDHDISKKLAESHANNDQYLKNKQDALKQLENDVNQQSELSSQSKKELKRDIRQTQNRTNQQRDLILDELNNSKDKNKSVKAILNNVMSQNEADQALKKIQTKGRSDEQIANQIAKQFDNLSHTSSDNILKSMLDQSKDKQQLIKQLLSTRLGDKEADRIANQLANGNLNNQQIVDQLKQQIDKQGNVTADDILNDVLNNAKDKRQAIETILATRIEQGKAKVLADIINRIQTDKASTLDLIKSAINGKANDLLQLQHKVDSAKKDLDYIISPIKDRPSIFDRINQHSNNNNSSLLDQLNSGRSLLDGIEDIPTPTPEKGLTLGSGDGLLEGLFNDDGNLSLPEAGQTIKQHWMPISIIIALFGASLIWISRHKRKHHQQ